MQNATLWHQVILESVNPGLTPKEADTRFIRDTELSQSIIHDYPRFLNTWYHAPLWGDIRSHPHFKSRLQTQSMYHPETISKVLTQFSVTKHPSYSHALSQLERSIHLISGSKDIKYERILSSLSHQSPFITHHSIQGVAHNTHFENPQRFLSCIQKILRTEMS